jgi:hypothetical protein
MTEKKGLRPVQGASYIRHDPELGQISIDLSQLEEPARIFCAQTVRVEPEMDVGSALHMIFAQMVPPRRVIAAVVVHLERHSFDDFVKSIGDDFRYSVKRLVSERETAVREFTMEEFSGVPTDRIAMFKATIGRCAVGPSGAQLDWYELSPRTLFHVAKGIGPVAGATPLVSISCSADCLQRLIESCDARRTERGQEALAE